MSNKSEAADLEEVRKRLETIIKKEKSSLIKPISTGKDQKSKKTNR